MGRLWVCPAVLRLLLHCFCPAPRALSVSSPVLILTRRRVFLLCLLCLALWWVLCGTDMCLEESWERGSVEQDVDVSVRNQHFQFGVHRFSDVSSDVERAQSQMAAGSWQEWSGWKTSDSSWGEGAWNKKWKEPGRESLLYSHGEANHR